MQRSEVRNLQITGCDIESNHGKDRPPTANVYVDSRGGSHAEVAITGAGLPLATPCTAVGAPLAETVGPAPFPAALVVKTLSADILLGDRN